MLKLLLFAVGVLCSTGALAYHGTISVPGAFVGTSVIAADASVGCQAAVEATGAPDWDTICILSPDVSTCATKNMSYTSGATCRLHYLCSGWVGDTSVTHYPSLSLGFVSPLTNVTQVEVVEKGHRGWIRSIDLLAVDGGVHSVYSTPSHDWDTPSEAYKQSPEQREGGAYYAPGIDYRGGVNVSRAGNACLLWSAQSFMARTIENGLSGATNNFCRNPDNDENGPWCLTAGLTKEYCTVPVTEGCADKSLFFAVDPPATLSYNGIRISMKHSQGAIPAIDAVRTTGSVAGACHADAVRGFWAAPNCNTCSVPYKGAGCNELTCTTTAGSVYGCVYGTCNNATDTCDCYAGFFGADCSSACPTTQDLTSIRSDSGKIDPSKVDIAKICSGHGTCDEGATGSGGCICAPTYATATCSVSCPRDPATGLVCSNNGTCSDGASGDGTCTCNPPRHGADCSRRLCGGKQCFNGNCIDNSRCACSYDGNNGFWSGLDCNKCAAGFTGSKCLTEVRNTFSVTGDAFQLAAELVASWGYTSSFTRYLLPRVDSEVTVTLENKGGFVELDLETSNGPSFYLRPDKTRPVASATFRVQGGRFSYSSSDQLLKIDPFAWLPGGMQSVLSTDAQRAFTITVDYIPGCGLSNDCGHGHCEPTAAALSEALAESYMYSRSARVMSKGGRSSEVMTAGDSPDRRRKKAQGTLPKARPTHAQRHDSVDDKREWKLRRTGQASKPSHTRHADKAPRVLSAKKRLPHARRSTQTPDRTELRSHHAGRGHGFVSHKHLDRRERGLGMVHERLAKRLQRIRHARKQTPHAGQRNLLQAAYPTISTVTPLVDDRGATYLSIDFTHDITGAATFGILSTGVVPDAMSNSDLFNWYPTNVDSFQDLQFTGASLGNVYFSGLTECQGYDIYVESVDDYSSPTVYSSPALWITNVKPFVTPTLLSSSVFAGSTSVRVTVSVSANAIVYACVTGPGGSLTAGAMRGCPGGQSATLSGGNLEGTITFGGQPPSTNKRLHWMIATACDDDATAVMSEVVTTQAGALPDLTSVTVTSVTPSGFDFSFTASAGGWVHYAVQRRGASAVSATEVKTIATGTPRGVAAKGSESISSGAGSFSVTGLDPGQPYVVRYITADTPQAAESALFPSVLVTTAGAPQYPTVWINPIGFSYGDIDFDASYNVDGQCNFAFVNQGHVIGPFTPGSLVASDNLNGKLRSEEWWLYSSGGGTETGLYLNLPSECGTYDMYVECMDGTSTNYSPLTFLGSYSMNSAANVGAITIDQVASGSGVLKVQLSVSKATDVQVCVVPTSGSTVDPETCVGGSKAQRRVTSKDAFILGGLTPSTTYDINYRGGTACPTPVYGTTAKQSATTTAAGAPDVFGVAVLPGTGNVTLNFEAPAPGSVTFVVQSTGGSVAMTKAAIDGLSVGGNVIMKETHPFVYGKNALMSASSALTQGTTYMLNFYTEDPGATSHNQYFTRYFTTAGTVPNAYAYVEYDNAHGQHASVSWGTDLQALVRYQVRLSEDDEPTVAQMLAESGTFVVAGIANLELDGFGFTTGTFDVNGLEPLTQYYIHYLVSDSAGLAVEDTVWSSYFETNDEGVARCGHVAGNQPCTKAAAANELGLCECFPGYTCDRGVCIDPAELYAGIAGQCKCDASTAKGHWNGTKCDRCLDGHFGSDCTISCANGEWGGSACTCTGHFAGARCDQCPVSGGFYGPSCDTAAAPTTDKVEVDTAENKITFYPTVTVLAYSEVFLNVTMHLEDSVDAFKIVEIILLKEYTPSSLAGYATFNSEGEMQVSEDFGTTAGPTSENTTCGVSTVVDMSLPSTSNNYVFSCHLQQSWNSERTSQSCRVQVPVGYSYALFRLVGNRPASADITFRATGGCCNGNGFCGKFLDDCRCVAHPDLGFFNTHDSCATCARGYTGARCSDFAGDARLLRTGTQSVQVGESRWYTFGIQENMKLVATMNADVDCDLAVTTVSRCGEGWYHYDGRCYKIFADPGDCRTPKSAADFCKTFGGEVASVRSADDIDFFEKMFTDTGIGDQEQAAQFCSTRVIIDGKRPNPKCADSSWPGNNKEADCLSDTSGACSWNGVSCVFDPNYNCHSGPSGSSVTACQGTGGSRRACQWVEYASPGRTPPPGPTDNCQAAFKFRDSTMTYEEVVDMMSNPTMSDIGTIQCDMYDFDDVGCKLLPYCIYDDWSDQCEVDENMLHGLYWNGYMNDYFDDKWYYGADAPNCAYVSGRLLGDHSDVFFGEMDCETRPTNWGPPAAHEVKPGSIAYGLGAVMCERPLTAVESTVDSSSQAAAVADQSRLLGVPGCLQDDTAHTHSCSLSSRTNQDFAVIRVVCQTAGAFDVNISMVRQGRLDGYFNTLNCKHSAAEGSWGGQICTECAPRYSGHECKIFDACTADSHCSQGTCNTGTGYCVCNANYYGTDCTYFCDASTCNGGSCNANFQVCPGPLGTSRPCSVEDPLCISCPGNRTGDRCETCNTGSWDVSSDCGEVCVCNGQPCSVTSGECQCYSDFLRGFWNVSTNCSTCVAGYYGASCTVACDAAVTCNGNGVCGADGYCVCNANYYGPTCNTFCSSVFCHNHGTCDSTGVCICEQSFTTGFWTGSTCATCSSGYWGSSCSTECQCNARGACDVLTGECNCFNSLATGYFTGSKCESCAKGWSGADCKTSTDASANKIGIRGKTLVSTTARLTKDKIGGSIIEFTRGSTNHLWMTTGKQLSEFTRPSTSTDSNDWSHTQSCTLGATTNDDNVIAAEHHDARGYALFLVNKTGGMMLSAVRTDGTAWVASDGSCKAVTANLYARPLYGNNNTGGTAESALYLPKGMVLDDTTNSLYVLYRVVNETLSINQVHVSRIFIWEDSDIRKGFTHPRQNQYRHFGELAEAHSITLFDDNGVKAVVIGGLDEAEKIVFVKVFLPTVEQPSLRPVYSWNPVACRRYTCVEVSRAAIAGSRFVTVIRTTTEDGSSRMLLVQTRIDGVHMKQTSSNFKSHLIASTAFLNCSFVLYDSYAQTIYIGLHDNGLNPGTVMKFDANFFRTYITSLPLSYEQSEDEKQIAVAARIDPSQRELTLVNQLTRSHLMHALLYEVEMIEPNVVDGNGGTLVNVTGNGFKDLGQGIFCKFGSRLNRQLAATFVDSTRIVCQAPMVTSFDPCVPVPLEIAFSGTSSFTDNQVLVTQANIPQVSSVLPSNRGGLTLQEPLTVVGSGFINTQYLTCIAVKKRYPATFVSSTSVLCHPDSQTEPVNTTLQVSLDGQSFTNNNVYYYFVGSPSFFEPIFGAPRVVNGVTYGSMTTRGFEADSASTVYLPAVTVTFFDSAHTDLQSRDAALRGHNVTVTLTARPVAPLDNTRFGMLRGTLSAPISRGVAEFTDLFLEYPGSGSYTLTFSSTYSGVSSRTLAFTIVATATKLVLQTPPPDFSTNKEALATPTVVVFSDVSANIATTEAAKVVPALVKINGTSNATSGSLNGDDVETNQGVATFDQLRIEDGEEGAFYRIVFTATRAGGVVLTVSSAPIRVAQCDATANWISRVVPDVGTLGAQVVTIKGWGYTKALESRTFCRFGTEAPIQARFVDKCNILCSLPARTVPMSAALEVTTTTLTEFSNYGFNYSYISSVQSLAHDPASTSYRSAAVVTIDPITLRFRDAFPSWVRHLDSVERTVHMQTTAPLLNASGNVMQALNTSGNAMVRFDGLRIGYPVIGRYGFFFSTDPNAAMPTIVGAANASAAPVTAPPTTQPPTVIVVNQTMPNGTACPVPLRCTTVGRRFVECLFPLPENEVSFTHTVSEEIIVPSNAANTTLVPVPTPVPPATPAPTTAAPTNGTSAPTAPPVPASAVFSALYLFDVTEGDPAELHFVGTYDMFTTGKRRLDRQPSVRIADVAGNTVTNFAAAPSVTASISPEPPCLAAAAAGVSQAQHEATCERLSGATVQVSNGIAAFTNLRFSGRLGEQYRLTFTINIAGVSPLVGGPMYTAVCPSSNALLDHVVPNWVTNTRGGVITAKGWDFQPDAALQLRVGTQSIDCNYVDTCTAVCPVQAAALASSRRAVATPGALDVSFAAGTTTSAAQSGAFQVKAASASHIGYARTARSYYRGTATPPATYNFTHGQSLVVTNNVTCTLLEAETTDDARDCYTSSEVVNVQPIFVAQQDSGSGDIFLEHGWDPTTNVDADVQLTLTRAPPTESRTISQIFRGNLSKATVSGITVFNDLQMVLPKSGDYVISMNTSTPTRGGGSFVSFTYTIRITPGTPRTLTVTTTQLQRNIDGNAFKVENNAGLGISAFIRDVSDNAIDINNLPGYVRLSMIATITPEVVLQPPPLQHIPVDPMNAVLNTSVFSGSPADLVSGFFDFSTATVNNLKFGARYNMTFRIDDAALTAIMPPQSILVTLASCPSGQYSKNMTSTCVSMPEGGETRAGNHTLWLYAVPGYWRPNFQDDTFYSCPGDNCNGGYYSDCVEGTTGPVCAVCEEDYGKQGTQCLKCPSDAVNIVVLLAIAIATLIVIVVMVNSNLSAEVRPKSVFSIVIKILLNHLQTATLMQDFQTKIKGIVKDLFDIQSQATPDTNFTSFACLTGWNMYAIFLMWMLVPIFVLGLPGIVAAVAHFVQKRSLAKKKARLLKELDRRRAMGLQTTDIEMHLEALDTKELPERIFEIDEDASDQEVSIEDPDDMKDMGLDELERREMAAHERRVGRREDRDAAVQERAGVLFRGDVPDDASQASRQSGQPNRSRRASHAPSGRRRSHAPEVRYGVDGKPIKGGGLDNCTICCADFAVYRCEECVDEPLFCEGCWKVVHAEAGERANHDRLVYRVANADKREYNKKYERLYEEVMATKQKVPALEIWIVTVLVVIFLIYPSLMTQIAMMMKCVYIESIDRSFLAADYTIECGTPEYNRWVAIARIFFFLYGVGIPLAGTILLTVKRKTLLEKSTMATYGFLYSGYRLRHFFWEFVIMVRKMLVVFIIVFYEGDSNYSIMFGMWLVLLFLIINIMVQPFQLRLYWRLENISLASVTITLNAAMLYQPRFNLNATEDALVTLFIFIVNVLVLAMFAYYIYFAAKLEMLQHFDLDGSGDVSWSEFVLVVKQWLHNEHGDTLRGWGFEVEDPTDEINAIRQARKEKIQRAAAENWKRGALLRARQKDLSMQNTPQASGAATPRAAGLDAEHVSVHDDDEDVDESGTDGDDLNSAHSAASPNQGSA